MNRLMAHRTFTSLGRSNANNDTSTTTIKHIVVLSVISVDSLPYKMNRPQCIWRTTILNHWHLLLQVSNPSTYWSSCDELNLQAIQYRIERMSVESTKEEPHRLDDTSRYWTPHHHPVHRWLVSSHRPRILRSHSLTPSKPRIMKSLKRTIDLFGRDGETTCKQFGAVDAYTVSSAVEVIWRERTEVHYHTPWPVQIVIMATRLLYGPTKSLRYITCRSRNTFYSDRVDLSLILNTCSFILIRVNEGITC